MYPQVRKWLFQFDAEKAHHLALFMLTCFPNSAKLFTEPPNPSKALAQSIWNLSFPHPVGLAAGLDKNAAAVPGLFHSGFSFVETGTVTPLPQPGNEQPRLFRLIEDEALINRMGFNNDGAETVGARLRALQNRQGVVGVNIGKNKWTKNEDATLDYQSGLDVLLPEADYIVVNVSSPNTPGLRDLQTAETLVPIVQTLREIRDRRRPEVPILVKLAPDLDNESLAMLATSLQDAGIDGFIATNTTIARPNLESARQTETGGLSGRPLQSRATDVIRVIYQATGGTIPIVGSGGIFTAEDAYEKIRAGASLVQIYTSYIYEGPAVVTNIVTNLARLLEEDGFKSIKDAIGCDHR